MKTQACIMGVLFVFLGAVYGDNTSATQNLLQACKANQILQIQKYIQEGADVNAANAQGILPLYYAVRHANSQAVELLIDHGAKVDSYSAGEGAEFNDVTMPVLMWAAYMKKNGMVSLLVSRGASLDIADSNRRHLRCLAVESNNTELLDMLVQKGESLNGRYFIGPKKCGSLLHIAVDMGNTSMLNYLLEKDIDIELRDELGRSPLISAVENNNLEMVKMLITKGAYLYATPGYGGTLLERDSGQVSPLILNYIRKSDREAKERIQPAAWAAFLVRDGFATKLDWKQLQEYLQQGGGIKGTDLDNNTLLHYAAASTEYPLEQLISGGLDAHAVNNHGETPLHWAVRYDRVENVKYLLEHGADVHARDKSGNTPLNTMANYFMNRTSGEKREVVITQMLLEYGADINARNSFGKAALASVSEERMEDCIDLIKLLIEKGADVNLRADKGGTALHIAAELGNPKTVQLLLEAGASVAIYDIYERNPLDAARYDQEQKIALMFPYKKDACIIDAVYYDQIGELGRLADGGKQIEHVHSNYNNGSTALILAAQKGSVKMVEKLIELNANVNARDTQGHTALHYAAYQGHDEIVAVLLRVGVDPAVKNKMGQTARDLAKMKNHLRSVQLLEKYQQSVISESLSKQAVEEKQLSEKAVEDVRMRGIQQREKYVQKFASMSDKPLHQAVIMGKSEFAKTMIDKDKTLVGKPDGNGLLPLMYAAMTGNKEMVCLLLGDGADINQLDENTTFGKINGVEMMHTAGEKAGWGVLHYLAGTDDIDMVEYMVSKGADVNLRDVENQTTPIWIACQTGNVCMMKTLIFLGAKLDMTDRSGDTLINYTAQIGNQDRIHKLILAGVNIETRDKSGRTPLLSACIWGKDDMVVYLLGRGADINAMDNNGNNALHVVMSEAEGAETVRVLIEHGVDVNHKNSSGQVPWFLLRRPGHDAESGVIDNLNLVLQAGADITARNNSGDSILHLAADLGSVEVGKLAVQYGADVNWVNNKGESPLNRCVTFSFDKIKQQSPELIDFLIAQGADVNLADAQKKTALHNAASRGDASIIQRLIDSGAQCDCKDALGKIPADYIPSDKKAQLLPLFEKKAK